MTLAAPSSNAHEEKSTPDAADHKTSADTESAAAAPKDESGSSAAPTTVAPAAPPAVEQTQSAATEKSAQADTEDKTCRRYVPSIGRTVEVPCEGAQEAERPPQSDTAPPPPQAEVALHPFKDMWGTSLAACQRTTGDWKESDRLIIFGSGALQYIHLGQSQICQGMQIEGSTIITFTLRAFCPEVQALFYEGELIRAAVEDGDITLAGDGQRLAGIGPDGQSLQLRKCN